MIGEKETDQGALEMERSCVCRLHFGEMETGGRVDGWNRGRSGLTSSHPSYFYYSIVSSILPKIPVQPFEERLVP
jgi:hypothetical protein